MKMINSGLALLLLLGANIVSGQDAPDSLHVDLDGDGKAETISSKKIGSDEEAGDFYQVLVKNPAGEVMWQSPRIMKPDSPLAFGSWHWGESLPQFAADVDGDGKVELLVPAPRSDVSPVTFRIFRWTGSEFRPIHIKALIPGLPGKLAWLEPSGDTWVERFIGDAKEGGWLVEISRLVDGRDFYNGRAVVRPDDHAGYMRIVRWTQPLKKAF